MLNYLQANWTTGKKYVFRYNGPLEKPCVSDWLILGHIHPEWYFGGWNIVFSSPVHLKLEFHGYLTVFIYVYHKS